MIRLAVPHPACERLLTAMGPRQGVDLPVVGRNSSLDLTVHARVQAVLEDSSGNAVRMTTAAHDPTPP